MGCAQSTKKTRIEFELMKANKCLTVENERQKKRIDHLQQLNVCWTDKIDDYVDKWFEKNKEQIDIGLIKLPFGFTVDVLPNDLEKHIYKKILKILFSFTLIDN